MKSSVGRSEIDLLGTAPWGTHFCMFYQTQGDLLDILVPYFKAGLEKNEYCMWITSEPLNAKDAEKAMRIAIPKFDAYLQKNQIEIIPYTEYYLENNEFDSQRVLNGLVDKCTDALDNGFNGLRITGNTSWLEDKNWKKFADYEEAVNEVITSYNMIAVCTYSLEKCGSIEILDVVRNYQYALFRREGIWEIFKSSDQGKFEQKLKESEERLKIFMESAPDTFMLYDSELNLIDINKIGVKRFPAGTKKEDIIGKSIIELSPDVKKTGRYDDYMEVIKTGNHFSIDEFIPHSKFGNLHISLNAFKVLNGLGIIARDITERRKVEIKLKESEKFLRYVQEIGHLGYWDWNVITGELYWSDETYRIYGFKPQEFVPTYEIFMSIVHPDDLDYVQSRVNSALQNDIKYSIDFRFVRPNGEIGHVYVEGDVTRDENGKAIRFVGTQIDITERKQTEQKLKESEKKYRELLENMMEGYYALDLKGNFTFANGYFCKTVGYSKEEIIGKNYHLIYDEKTSKKLFKMFNQLYKSGIPLPHTNRAEGLTNRGKQVFLEGIIDLIYDSEGNKIGFYGFAREITEKIKAEQKLEEINKLKSEFLRRASHELKTPLISIKGFSELILSLHEDQLDPSINLKLREINAGCERLQNIIDNLLKTSRLESPELRPSKDREDLSFLIKFCLLELESIAERRKQSIKLDIHDQLYVNIEKEEIHDVLSNLLSNAIKYTPPNGIIEIKTELKEEFVVVSVTDNGIGFTEDQKKKIFQQFGKIERYGQGLDLGIDGTGLGLFISKRIVESHGGKIWMESEGENMGSTFSFSLPTKIE